MSREGSELECETGRKCLVLLELNMIHTKMYIQCSNLRRILAAKAGAENRLLLDIQDALCGAGNGPSCDDRARG